MNPGCVQRWDHLEDFKAGDVQDPDEGGPLPFGAVQGPVDAVHQPAEEPLVRRLGQRLHGKVCLVGETEARCQD